LVSHLDMPQVSSSSSSGVFPRYLRYWINSIPLETCLLFENNLADFSDGQLVASVISHIYGMAIPHTTDQTSACARTRAAICLLGAKEGWTNLPAFIQESALSDLLCETTGSEETKMIASQAANALFEFLFAVQAARDKGESRRLAPLDTSDEITTDVLAGLRLRSESKLNETRPSSSILSRQGRRKARVPAYRKRSLSPSPSPSGPPRASSAPKRPAARFANLTPCMAATVSRRPPEEVSPHKQHRSESRPTAGRHSLECYSGLTASMFKSSKITDAAAASYLSLEAMEEGCRARRLDTTLLNTTLRRRVQLWLASLGLGHRAELYKPMSALKVVSAKSPVSIATPPTEDLAQPLDLSDEWCNGQWSLHMLFNSKLLKTWNFQV
jgi:hypothetical protein